MRKGILTIVAIDNIDQNSKSTTATKHYHGTSLSIFQFPTEENPGVAVDYENLEQPSKHSSLKVDALPSSFTYVKNFLVSFQTLKPPKLPPTPFPTTPDNNYRTGVSSEVKWLATANTSDVYTSWVQYHSKNIHYTRKPDISVILPLIDSHVHTLDTQYHCMEIAKKTTQLLNPLQITCGGCDQPVFKITKDLQWRFPELFGQDKYFCIFGSLHIEKSILILCSSLIEGSGLNKIMNSCGLSIVGTDSLVTVNHITRARYCIQVAACVIFSLLTWLTLKAVTKNL